MSTTTFEFTTGRTYNGPQVLRVTPMGVTEPDAHGLFDVTYTIEDASRNMRISITTIEFDEFRCTGTALNALLLCMYDNGQYTEL